MILTITLNPSVDIGYKLEALTLNDVNRVSNVSKTAGGKGLNVARVLNQLGENVAATGYLGGNLGDFIREQINDLGIKDLFVSIRDETRNCIGIIHDDYKQTEILESGPIIDKTESDKFIHTFQRMIGSFHYVTISGSLPTGLSHSFYIKIINIAKENKVPVLLDTHGKLLVDILKEGNKPYLIKPNQNELAELVGKTLIKETDIVEVLHSTLFNDIPWVVVTLGADGALIKYDHQLYRVHIPKVTPINSVGSGDSVIAGFAAGFNRQMKTDQLIKFGLSLGVLNAMEERTGYINLEKIEEIMNGIIIKQIG